MDVVVVTGASRGLGRFCAQSLHDCGYRVVGLGRSAVTDAPFEMRSANVADPVSVAEALGDLRRDPSVYALINAAGIASMNLVVTTPAATARSIVETNLLGTIYCCQQIAPALIKRGGGRIINFSTLGVQLAIKGEAIYIASKAGVEAFSRTFAREMAPYGVTVNTVAPGPIDTALLAKVPKANVDEVVRRQIVPRQAEPVDVWNIVSMLLAPESSMLSGETLHVGGA
ncbi:MAG: SDR family oxidoreductase [Gemmatimonadaceae bacterium]|nr:SDR family oxidoreductase [Gemmatimonadaceae bacterium]MDQ3242298.1 SDR family oxidoreductase [Gemmatimonadota bacterium]